MAGNGQKRSQPRKRFLKALGGTPYPHQLIGNREEGVLGYYLRYDISTDDVIIEYYKEGKLEGVAREMPLAILFQGKSRRIIYKQVPKPTYQHKID